MSPINSKNIVLVTGPPGNGRDEYIERALPILRDSKQVGYYHVFQYMKEVALSHGIPNLTRENVLTITKAQLDRIRDSAFNAVYQAIKESDNEIEIVSTPANFRIRPWAEHPSGWIEGLKTQYIEKINPNCIIIFIDDLLRVRDNMTADMVWSKIFDITLRNLAEWRNTAIVMIDDYYQTRQYQFDWIIFAREHPIETFIDIIINSKPKLYISYPITGHEDFESVTNFIDKLSDNFICIDPYTIKDWSLVTSYDNKIEALTEGEIQDTITITINYNEGKRIFEDIPLSEIEEAIDLIRTQIVDRDLQLIRSVHATVVYHKVDRPSYGVMTEVIHSRSHASNPVYVIYPYKKRLSPFFEHYVPRENRIQGNIPIEELEDELKDKLISDYPSWPTWIPQTEER